MGEPLESFDGVPVKQKDKKKKRKKGGRFEGSFPVLCALIYLLLGFLGDLWHPGWLIFLTVPIYYTFVGCIHGARLQNSRKSNMACLLRHGFSCFGRRLEPVAPGLADLPDGAYYRMPLGLCVRRLLSSAVLHLHLGSSIYKRGKGRPQGFLNVETFR